MFHNVYWSFKIKAHWIHLRIRVINSEWGHRLLNPCLSKSVDIWKEASWSCQESRTEEIWTLNCQWWSHLLHSGTRNCIFFVQLIVSPPHLYVMDDKLSLEYSKWLQFQMFRNRPYLCSALFVTIVNQIC